jgi:hypothetical protein
MTAKLQIVTESGVEIDVPLNKLRSGSRYPSPRRPGPPSCHAGGESP